MATTLEAPTPTTRRRRTRHDPNPKRLERALLAWAAAIETLAAAADACDALSGAMGDLLPGESDSVHGEDVREDSWHCGYFIRSQLSLIESDAPHEVRSLVRAAS